MQRRRVISQVSLAVGLVGPGAVGKALLEQLRVAIPKLQREGINLEVRSILNANQMLLAKEQATLDLSNWDEDLIAKGSDASLGVMTEHLKASDAPHRVIIDCTPSAVVPRFYPKWMEQGIHVVTPNKRLNSGPFAAYSAVKSLQASGAAHYMYEGTVGAGLPIISTLKNMLDTGDDAFSGTLAGTLSYIFNTLKPSDKFSEVVWGARRRGYTEPDLNEDLGGVDSTRKITTLARECGMQLEMGDVQTESLIPASMGGPANLQQFMAELAKGDEDWSRRLQEVEDAGEVIRFIGSYDAESGVCQVGPRRILRSHPLASLTGTEIMVSFTTARYSSPSLVIRGPGAGPAVTASGVFGDIIRLARYLGAHS
ncbi:hypothetical protein QBZ16_002560 [Prototheca wickerhamii]|uniref:Homoserine dehydrogenase n=1 Tax=Prototheca wickerhamii TaxID=3111 RepID=A0AAD9MKY2_PROWI|nr:hypothetical protein QBZ16_002560 [Prototheca wickerhamii]